MKLARRCPEPRLLRGCAVALACMILAFGRDLPASERVRDAVLRVERLPGSESCPDERRLSRALEDQLRATPPVNSGQAPVEFDIVFRGGQRLGADVVVRGARSGTRSLRAEGAGCRELADALVVMLAMLMDADPARERALHSPAASRKSEADRPSHSRSLWASAGGGAGYARPYRLGLLVTGEVELRHPVWRAAVGGFWSKERAVAAPPPGEVAVSLVAGSARGCRILTRAGRNAELGLCGVLSAGALTGSGTGYTSNRSSRRLWGAVGAAVDLTARISDVLGFGALALVEAPLSRQNFAVEFERRPAEIAYEPGAVSVALSGRVSVRLW